MPHIWQTSFTEELFQLVAARVLPAIDGELDTVESAWLQAVYPVIKVHQGLVRPHVRLATQPTPHDVPQTVAVIDVTAHQTEPVVVQRIRTVAAKYTSHIQICMHSDSINSTHSSLLRQGLLYDKRH